jgi:hypothetical protein
MEDVPSPYALTQNIRHSRWDGDAWSKPDNVSQQKDMQANLEDPRLVVGDSGDLHVVWEDRNKSWYGHFGSGHWSEPRQLNQSDLKSGMPQVGIAEEGRLHFTWLGVTDGKPQVFYRQLQGEQWSDCINISRSPGEAFGCTLALDSSRRLHLTWMDNRTGEYEIMHRRIVAKAPTDQY